LSKAGLPEDLKAEEMGAAEEKITPLQDHPEAEEAR
jgi:hypothetical protein